MDSGREIMSYQNVIQHPTEVFDGSLRTVYLEKPITFVL